MLRHKYMYVLLSLCCVLFIISGCDRNDEKIDFSVEQNKDVIARDYDSGQIRPLRLVFASLVSPLDTWHAYKVMADYLSRELGRPVVLLQRRTYEEVDMMLAGGEADIAFLSTGAYLSYHGIEPLDLVAVPQMEGQTSYKTYLVVPADSEAVSIEGLKGGTFAFTDPQSNSGRMAVDEILRAENVTPEQFFKRYFYTYNHDKSLLAVANHLADGAAVDSFIYDFLSRQAPELISQVRIIDILGESPAGPVVMRADMPPDEKEAIRKLFWTMAEYLPAKEAMSSVMIDKFVPADVPAYDALRRERTDWPKGREGKYE